MFEWWQCSFGNREENFAVISDATVFVKVVNCIHCKRNDAIWWELTSWRFWWHCKPRRAIIRHYIMTSCTVTRYVGDLSLTKYTLVHTYHYVWTGSILQYLSDKALFHVVQILISWNQASFKMFCFVYTTSTFVAFIVLQLNILYTTMLCY